MKVLIKIHKSKEIPERIVESNDILDTVEEVIKEIGGTRNGYKVYCETIGGVCEYVIFKGGKKVARLSKAI